MGEVPQFLLIREELPPVNSLTVTVTGTQCHPRRQLCRLGMRGMFFFEGQPASLGLVWTFAFSVSLLRMGEVPQVSLGAFI